MCTAKKTLENLIHIAIPCTLAVFTKKSRLIKHIQSTPSPPISQEINIKTAVEVAWKKFVVKSRTVVSRNICSVILFSVETVQGCLCIQLNQIGLFDKIVNVENFFFEKAIREISFLHLKGKAA